MLVQIEDNALDVLGTKKVEQLEGRLNFTETRFQRDASGQLVEYKQDVKLLNRVLDKSKELVYNVSKAFDFVDDEAKGIKDVDGINDIRATIKQNRVRDDGTQLINDAELNTAMKNTTNFLEQYEGRVSGAYANRFGRASSSSPKLDKIQAQGELNTATDILNGNTVLGNDVKMRGLPDKTNTQTNPDYLAILPDTNTRLVEVKTMTGKVERNLSGRLRNAIGQIEGNILKSDPTRDGYIRLDYRNANSTNRQSDWWSKRINEVLKEDIENLAQGIELTGFDVIEFVEVLYSNPEQQVKTLLFKVQNGTATLVL